MSGRTVWKVPVPSRSWSADVPGGDDGRVLHVGLDPNGRASLWVEVDPTLPPSPVAFLVVGTGHALPSGVVHVGSFIEWPFVWHVYREAAS